MDELGDVATKLADLVAPAVTFRYDYDFGDGWEHDVRVLRTPTADCSHRLDGARGCPQQACAGPPATSARWRRSPTRPTPSTTSSPGGWAPGRPRGLRPGGGGSARRDPSSASRPCLRKPWKPAALRGTLHSPRQGTCDRRSSARGTSAAGRTRSFVGGRTGRSRPDHPDDGQRVAELEQRGPGPGLPGDRSAGDARSRGCTARAASGRVEQTQRRSAAGRQVLQIECRMQGDGEGDLLPPAAAGRSVGRGRSSAR